MEKRSINTVLTQAGHYIAPVTGAVIPPVQPSTTFARDEDYLPGDYPSA